MCNLRLAGRVRTNGFFTGALLTHLREMGHGLDVRRLMGHVRDTVLADTKGRQRPWVNEALPRHDVYMLPNPVSVGAPPPLLHSVSMQS